MGREYFQHCGGRVQAYNYMLEPNREKTELHQSPGEGIKYHYKLYYNKLYEQHLTNSKLF